MKKFIISLVLVLVGPITALAAGPAPVDLLSAGNFTILSKAGITNTGSHTSAITGNIGSSPITAAAMDNVFCSEITGTIYGINAAYTGSGVTACFAGNPPLSNKISTDTAVLDMGTAYNDAAGRSNPTATELGAGNIGGLTIAPGLYKWGTDVIIPTNITLSGSSSDVWIFQIAGNLDIASAGSLATGTKVILAGGAKASNIFWQVGGVTGATLGTYSTFNGNILSAKQVILETGAVLNGRALAQTQVTLDANRVTADSVSPTPTPTPTPAVSTTPATPASPQLDEEEQGLDRLLNYYNVRYQIKCIPSGIPVSVNDSACIWAKINLIYAQDKLSKTVADIELTSRDLYLMNIRIVYSGRRYDENCSNVLEPDSSCPALGKNLSRARYFLNQ